MEMEAPAAAAESATGPSADDPLIVTRKTVG
jgi:hypothetical protein